MRQLYTSNLYAADRRHEYSVDELRPYFLGDSGLEMEVPDADVISPAPPTRRGPTLSYSRVPGEGYSLVWQRGDVEGGRLPTMMSVRDPRRMDDWMENPDQSRFPTGSLVPGEVAIRVIEDFARDPDVLSDAVEWCDSNRLAWPEP